MENSASTPSLQEQFFRTTDVDQAGEFLTRLYGTGIRLRCRCRSFQEGAVLTHTRTATDSFTIDVGALTGGIAFTVEPMPHQCVISRPLTTIVDYRGAGEDLRFGPGDVYLGTRTDGQVDYRFRWHDGGGTQLVSLLCPLLSRIAAAESTRHPEPIRFTDPRPRLPGAARQLAATFDYLAEALRDRPEAMAEPLVSSAAGRLLAAQVLTAFPSTACTEPSIEDRRDARSPQSLRRAMTFIDEHAHEDISAADIAEAAHVTIRTLQYAFREHRETTPMAHLRRVRLHRAHRELLAADPATGLTVTQIAARWGFFHPGRFAGYYRAVYGVPPCRTLRRDAP